MSHSSPTPQKPTGLVIKLPYRSLDEFAVRFRPNLSDGGMFVRTKEPRPRGTQLVFKIELADGSVALHGKAVSRWVRLEPDESGPAGMAVEFLHLEPEGRALINRMLGRGAPAPTRATPVPTPAKGLPVAAPLTPARGLPVAEPLADPFAAIPGAPPPPKDLATELFSDVSGLRPAPDLATQLFSDVSGLRPAPEPSADLFAGVLQPLPEEPDGATFTDPEVFELLNAKKD